MRILIVMDPGILVPPTGYGGHERLVYMFAREYARLGHEVHLLVTKGSHVEGCTVHSIGNEGFPPARSQSGRAVITAWKFLWTNRKKFDLIHNFGRLAYLLPVMNSPVKKIMTYGREISSRNISIANALPKKNLVYTGCSTNLISRIKATRRRWHTVYNAIDFNQYELQEKIPFDAPLIFLSRIERVKGLHTAIEVAKATGNQLIIAGNISPLKEEKQYYKEEIEPYLNDHIQYVGTVDDKMKNYYLGKSKALLFPIELNEPFGMVMAEAMACGTPVIAFNRGSVPEVIEEGVTGIIAKDKYEMIAAVSRIDNIDRSNCRKVAKKRFDVSVIAQNYLGLFE